jgi:gas vesicle protein
MRWFSNFMAGLILGGLVGAVTALILAPDTGAQLRQDLRRELDDILTEGRKAAADRRAELEAQLAQLRR